MLAASYWYTYKVVKDYVEGPVKDPDRLDRADQFWVLAAGGLMLALLATGVVSLAMAWCWRLVAHLGRHRGQGPQRAPRTTAPPTYGTSATKRWVRAWPRLASC